MSPSSVPSSHCINSKQAKSKSLMKQPLDPRRMYTVPQAYKLIKKSSILLSSTNALLDEARKITARSGLSVDSSLFDASYQSPFLPSYFQSNTTSNNNGTGTGYTGKSNNEFGHNHHIRSTSNNTVSENNDAINDNDNDNYSRNNNINDTILKAYPPILSTTGGHSNIDHIIQFTGNHRDDRIAEYKRKLKRRIRSMQPEQKGTDRWDQPRISGSRRRRIVREMDLPCAPPEPPHSGYVIFIAQMTTKIRHDRPHVHHNQIKVVREISKIWKYGMSDIDRDYYNDFCRETREEYERLHAEYKATGSFKQSRVFERLHGDGPWVRIAYHEKNSLEREMSGYESVKFPPRPLEMEKPDWLKKIEKAKAREMERRKEREERIKRRRETERTQLEAANVAKVRRLNNPL